MSKNYVILDCDGGSDDAWALLLLLRANAEKRITLLAITICGNGNTDLVNASRNVFRILKAMKNEEIPIFHGASESLIPINAIDQYKTFHGTDGFGDVFPESDIVMDNVIRTEHAVHLIHRLVCEHPKKITLMALGPLTNIALCCSMYAKEFTANVGKIFIMGGNYQGDILNFYLIWFKPKLCCTKGAGNTTKCAEFNFYMDPESANIVLMKIQCPITILPWEPCMEDRFTLSLNWRLNVVGVEAAEYSNAIPILNIVEESQYSSKTWNPCDAMLCAAFLCPKIISRASYWHATVDLTGRDTRGQMVLDHLHNVLRNPKNVIIIEQIDEEIFKNVIQWASNCPKVELESCFPKKV